MAAAAKSILVEVAANTTELKAGLIQGQRDLQAFSNFVKTEPTRAVGAYSATLVQAGASAARVGPQAKAGLGVAADAAKGMGDRYATATLQVSNAMETVARSGSVAGEAGRQLIAQGSQMAFMFGPKGAIVGAIGISIMAVVEWITRTRKEIAELKKQAEENLDQLQDRGDRQGLKERAQVLYEGTPSNDFQDGIRHFEQEIAKEQERFDRSLRQRNVFLFNAARGRLRELREQVAPLLAEFNSIRERMLDPGPRTTSPRDPITITAKSPETLDREADEAERQWHERYRRAVEKGSRLAEELRSVGEASGSFADKVESELARLSPSTVVSLTESLRQLNLEYLRIQADPKEKALLTPAQEDSFRKLGALYEGLIRDQETLRRATPTLREVDELLESIAAKRSRAAADGVVWAPTEDERRRLEAQRRELEQIVATTTRGTQAQQEATERLRAVEGEIAGIRTTAAQKDEARTERLKEQSRLVMDTADGALQLASAFGAVDQSIINSLRSLLDISTHMPGLIETIKRARTPDLSNPFQVKNQAGVGEVIGAALPVVGAAASLFSLGLGLLGESPEAKEAKRITRELSDRLADLTQRIGDLGQINLTGNEVITVSAVLDRVLSQQSKSDKLFDQVKLDVVLAKELHAVGLTVEELRSQLQQYGVELGEEIEAGHLEYARQIIAAAEWATFGDTFAGQMQRIQASVQLFGEELDEPAEQFTAFVAAFDKIKGGGGVLAETLKGLDVSNAEGVAAAQQALADLFRRMPELLPADFAGIAPPEFLEAILQANQYLQQIMDTFEKVPTQSERLTTSLEALGVTFQLLDQDDPAAQFGRITEKILETVPALAELTAGLDLTTREGLDTFGERVSAFVERVRSGAVVIEGFTADQIIAALLSWETTSDQAAQSIVTAVQTVTTAIAQLNAELDILDIAPGSEEGLAKFVATVGQLAPALAGLGQFDLSSTTGREGANTFLQGLFYQNRNGTLDAAGRGGLTQEEFENLLLQGDGLLDSLPDIVAEAIEAAERATAGAAGGRATGGATTYSGLNQLSAVQGSQLIDAARTQVDLLRMIAGNTSARAGSGGLLPPSMPYGGHSGPIVMAPTPAPTSGGAGSGGPVFHIQVTVEGGSYDRTPQDVGHDIARGIMGTLDEELGRLYGDRLADTGRILL
jgi:hypothetical protein